MYSGNHSPCHPLDTLLEAAARLRDRSEIAFCFVGGGSEQNKVRAFADEKGLSNILCLPYQPLAQLSASLSAGDLHVIAMGDSFAGILHPCKVYNILAIDSPFLYIGPNESHIADILSQTDGRDHHYQVNHGDVDSAVRVISESASRARGRHNRRESSLARDFAKEALLPRLINVLESVGAKTQDGPSVSEARPAAQFAPAGEPIDKHLERSIGS
jgi:hypothetical protein